MKLNSKIIYNLAFFSIIFMYFRFLPTDIETQPIFVILLIPLFITSKGIKMSKKIKIKSEEKYLYIYLFIIALYYLFSLFSSTTTNISYLLKFILGPISYLFLLRNVELLEVKTIKLMTLILFIVSVVYITHLPILFSAIKAIAVMFISRYSFGFGEIRGLSILTPEPSYFVYFAMLLLYSFDFLEYKNKTKENIFYKILIYFMCIFTKSALVYLFLVIYLSVKFLYDNQKINLKLIFRNILIIFFVFIFVVFFTDALNINLINNRFTQVIHQIKFTNIIDVLFYTDESAGFRFIINSIYALSIFIKPFGNGLLGLETQWSSVAKIFGIDYRKNGAFIYTYSEKSHLPAQALFPNVIGAIGVFTIFLLLFFYKNNKIKNKKLKTSILISLTAFLMFIQSNMFNPVFWILIAFCKYQENSKGDLTIKDEILLK